jgi:indolepyruvate ferredoxin oxidoreductase, beta subunit
MQNGFVDARAHALIASTHRIYATHREDADGRRPLRRASAARRRAAAVARACSSTCAAQAERHGDQRGAVRRAGRQRARCPGGARPARRRSARRHRRGASLRGFAAASIAAGERARPPARAAAARRRAARGPALGRERLRDYQGERYVALYDRAPAAVPGRRPEARSAEVARQLALWMSYEDIIRVADLKTRASALRACAAKSARSRRRAGVVIDYLKPGVEEFASVMPPRSAGGSCRWAERRGKLDAYNVGMHIKTSGVFGYCWCARSPGCGRWRPMSHRYQEEQAADRTLARPGGRERRSATRPRARDRRLRPADQGLRRDAPARQSQLPRHRRRAGREPPHRRPREQAAAIRKAREAALADPEGKRSARRSASPLSGSSP